ncbi:MAG: SAM-dependent DNA methyltransferase [Candidatus Lokiarchaeota archaeon]|nr:SAM-dependent DNA methyltransferase [Candidatus Lokiarchaeota archaeon]
MEETHTFEYHLRESDKIKAEFLERTIQAKAIKTENLNVAQKPEMVIIEIFDAVLDMEGIPTENRYHEVMLGGTRSPMTSEFMIEQRRYPDMRIMHGNPEYKDILIEFEPASSKLTNGTDGVTQARNWIEALRNKTKYVAIATSGFDSYVIKWDPVRNAISEEEHLTFGEVIDFIKRTALEEFIPATSREPKKDITKRFYSHYKALMIGGNFTNPQNRRAQISDADCLINNILNVDRAANLDFFAHVFFMRLIFLRIISSWRLIPDVLAYINSAPDEDLNGRMRQLFFSILDTETERRVGIPRSLETLPYLNGGLFRRLAIEQDNPELYITPKIVRLIIDFLNAYQFAAETTDLQNNIDPEILGYIFEQSMYTRSQEGAFYTPKEVTRFMSQAAIQKVLVKKVNQLLGPYTLTHLDQVFSLPDSLVEKIFTEFLIPIKILDPAVGSGAFLLACGDELMSIHQRFNERLGRTERPEDTKRKIIAVNLHGNDKDPTAIEICQLRLWLWVMSSLEEGAPIPPLPNLDFKMMAGNSLIGITKIDSLVEVMAKLEQTSLDQFLSSRPRESGPKKPSIKLIRAEIESLSKLMQDFVLTEHKADQSRLKTQIDERTKKIRVLLHQRSHADFNEKGEAPIENLDAFIKEVRPFHPALEFCEVFSKHKGFDIVIANPPYLDWDSTKVNPDKRFRHYYDVCTGIMNGTTPVTMVDLFDYFIVKALSLVNPTGIVEMIVRNNVMEHPIFPIMLPIMRTFDNVGVGIFEGGYNKEASIFMLDPEHLLRTPRFEFRSYLGTPVADRLSLLGKMPIEYKSNLTNLADPITAWVDEHLSTWKANHLEVHRGEELGKTKLRRAPAPGLVRIYHVTHLLPFSVSETNDPRYVEPRLIEKDMYSRGCVGLGYNIGNRIKCSNLGTRPVIKSVLCVYGFPDTPTAIPSFLALYNSSLIDYYERKIYDPFTEKRAFVIGKLPGYPYSDLQDPTITTIVRLLEQRYSASLHDVLDMLIFEIVFRSSRKARMGPDGAVLRSRLKTEIETVLNEYGTEVTAEQIVTAGPVREQVATIQRWPWVKIINKLVPIASKSSPEIGEGSNEDAQVSGSDG